MWQYYFRIPFSIDLGSDGSVYSNYNRRVYGHISKDPNKEDISS